MDVVLLGQMSKNIENFISDFDLTLYVFPPASRQFAFGIGRDGYAIGDKLFWVAAGNETRKCAGMSLGWTRFLSDGIANTIEPIKEWSDEKVRDYAKEQGLLDYVRNCA
jgi:hypothetical protein